MELWHSTQMLNGSDNWAKARQLQGVASLAESELLSGGVSKSCNVYIRY
jgi:4-hydroxy-2-oxoglutarate aldolase